MAKGKTANPADAFRKTQRQKELKKNKASRKVNRDVAVAKKDTFELEGEIRKLTELEDGGKISPEDAAKLKDARFELARIKKIKEAYLKDHPDERHLVYRSAPRLKNDAEDAPRDATGRKMKARRIFDEKTGLPRHPERSLYYHPEFNRYGVPPPGMPYAERPLLPGEVDSEAEDEDEDEEEDSDDDIPMPPMPPDDDGLDDIPMPEGPPPGVSAEDDDFIPPLPDDAPPLPSEMPPLPPGPSYDPLAAPPLPPGPPPRASNAPPFPVGFPAPPHSIPPPPPGVPFFGAIPPPPPGGPPFVSIPPPPPGGPPTALIPPPPPGRPPMVSVPQPPPGGPPFAMTAAAPVYFPPPPSSYPPTPSSVNTAWTPAIRAPFVPPPGAGLPRRPDAPPAVIVAEPELRDLKREATAFVPAALRKAKRPAPSAVQAAPGADEAGSSDKRADLVDAVRKKVKRD